MARLPPLLQPLPSLLLHPLRRILKHWHDKEEKLPLWSHLPPEEMEEIDGILLDLRADLKTALNK